MFTAVQMIGTQRSGSNLLRLMLNQLPEVSAPHPPHIIERFMPLLPMYGNLDVKDNFKNLAADVCRLVTCNPVPWPSTAFNTEAIIEQCKHNTLVEITRVIYEENAKSKGAHIWMCKSMSNIHYVDELESSLQPLYLFLYRDGRDVVCSFKNAVVGEKHVYNIAMQWKKEQDLCIALQQHLGHARFISVCYEQLIADPEKELKKICSFIGADYYPDCLQFYHSGEAKKTAASGAMWQNVEQRILSHNYNKYRKQLSKNEIILFENIAGVSLLKLGYQLQFPPLQHRILSEEEINNYSIQNNLLKQEARKNQSPQDAEKRKLQDVFLKSLQAKKESFVSSCKAEQLVKAIS